jgi:hypothetical protein
MTFANRSAGPQLAVPTQPSAAPALLAAGPCLRLPSQMLLQQGLACGYTAACMTNYSLYTHCWRCMPCTCQHDSGYIHNSSHLGPTDAANESGLQPIPRGWLPQMLCRRGVLTPHMQPLMQRLFRGCSRSGSHDLHCALPSHLVRLGRAMLCDAPVQLLWQHHTPSHAALSAQPPIEIDAASCLCPTLLECPSRPQGEAPAACQSEATCTRMSSRHQVDVHVLVHVLVIVLVIVSVNYQCILQWSSRQAACSWQVSRE